MEYVDDISKITSNHSSMENFKHNTSEILKSRDLNAHHDKTEQYIIKKPTTNGDCVNISEACWNWVKT